MVHYFLKLHLDQWPLIGIDLYFVANLLYLIQFNQVAIYVVQNLKDF